nr:hypothetical protein [Streptomyces cinnamoneus]
MRALFRAGRFAYSGAEVEHGVEACLGRLCCSWLDAHPEARAGAGGDAAVVDPAAAAAALVHEGVDGAVVMNDQVVGFAVAVDVGEADAAVGSRGTGDDDALVGPAVLGGVAVVGPGVD